MAAIKLLVILATVLSRAAEPPPDLLKRTLEQETASEAERGNYAYRQSVRIEELETNGRKRG